MKKKNPRGFRNVLLSAAVAVFLSSCQTAPPSTVTPELSFEGLPKVNLNVARIDVVNDYRPPMQAPNVDHLFRQSPALVAGKMIDQQLVANGSYNTLRITIEDASVIKRDLPVTQGIEGAFHNEEAEEYKARVALRFELVPDNPGEGSGHASVVSERTKTLLEDASPADRDMAYFNMNEQIMRDLKEGFNGVVQRTFGWK